MKQLLTTLVIFLISSALLISCSNTASESGTNTATSKEEKSTFDLAAAKKAIDSTNAVFGTLVSKGDSVGLAAFYTSDGQGMGEHMPTACGSSAIQSAFEGMFAAMGTPGLKLTATEVSGTQDLVSEVGTYSMTDKAGKEFDKGKYIVLWKMEDGKWKLHRDIFNSDLPPMTPPK
jgi:ketosteroid isomerase-like protein